MNFLIICKLIKFFQTETSLMIFNASLAIRKFHWPTAFSKVKVELELQQICILQFLQSSEDQNQLCLASPPVAEILGATWKFLLDILKVSEITVWASSQKSWHPVQGCYWEALCSEGQQEKIEARPKNIWIFGEWRH